VRSSIRANLRIQRNNLSELAVNTGGRAIVGASNVLTEGDLTAYEQDWRKRDRGKALAGKSTLNRLELTPVRANADSRYQKIVAHLDALQGFLVEVFIQQHATPPTRLPSSRKWSTSFPSCSSTPSARAFAISCATTLPLWANPPSGL